MSASPKIVLIGAGNVGYHLGQRMVERGLELIQVFSRTKEKAKELGKLLNVPFCTNLDAIQKADVYILAVHDDAIGSVAKQLNIEEKALMVHTSGATPSTVFKPFAKRYGVFYPLQTFSRDRTANFEEIPFCVDANRKKDRILLEQLAQRLSPKVYQITDKERESLHIAAVFVNNFTNYLYQIGTDICEKEKVPFDLLKPLILETARKVQEHPPEKMQTGPAKRGDEATIQRHLKNLERFPHYQELYQHLTEEIINFYAK